MLSGSSFLWDIATASPSWGHLPAGRHSPSAVLRAGAGEPQGLWEHRGMPDPAWGVGMLPEEGTVALTAGGGGARKELEVEMRCSRPGAACAR